MTDINDIFKKVKEKGAEEAVIEMVTDRTSQVRFSGDSLDLFNRWNSMSVSIFVSRGKRVASTTVRDMSDLDNEISNLMAICSNVPENPSYNGINSESQTYPSQPDHEEESVDIQQLAGALMKGAVEGGAERSSGLVYHRDMDIEIKTEYNHGKQHLSGVEMVVRAFRGDSTGQESIHSGPGNGFGLETALETGRAAGRTSSTDVEKVDIDQGKYDLLLSPYVTGNLLSYSSGFFSAYAVESGLSCFAGKIGHKVASDLVTLEDDPLNTTGSGFRIFDEEGTITGKNTLISSGTLKTYLHSFSTGKKFEGHTTGNAGIVSPKAWQLSLAPGKSSIEDMISEIDRGLVINNAWYTRFQDYRNGVFSTVPRDGVYLVKNGEIMGRVSGIRISDSVPDFLKNISHISMERKNVRWWEEISPSIMPSVLARDMNISKAF
ncbi:MAG: metallopeptidase TldD-related protein [Thermoplasmataceae archaeon]